MAYKRAPFTSARNPILFEANKWCTKPEYFVPILRYAHLNIIAYLTPFPPVRVLQMKRKEVSTNECIKGKVQT